MKITLGKNMLGDEEFLNYEKYETRHVLLVGVTRSGKSNELEWMIKQCCKYPKVERPNICLIDDQQEYGRLRHYNPDFIIIGDGGDLPIVLEQAYEIGRQVRIQKLDVIIRISSLFEEVDRYEFLKQFIRGMTSVEQKYWYPMWFICDEAQKFASSKESTARNAISTLATTGIKQGIMLILATLRIKSIYTDIRTQCLNHIIGYMDDPDERELACEAMHIPKSESKIFDQLEMGKGKFFIKGVDISKNHILIQTESMGWKTHDEKYLKYPPISETGRKLAEQLRESTCMVHIDVETMLRMEVARLQFELQRARTNELTEDDEQRIMKTGYLKGWDEAKNDDLDWVMEIKEQVSKPAFFQKQKTFIIIKEVKNGRIEIKSEQHG